MDLACSFSTVDFARFWAAGARLISDRMTQVFAAWLNSHSGAFATFSFVMNAPARANLFGRQAALYGNH
jgi:hypothetical protein